MSNEKIVYWLINIFVMLIVWFFYSLIKGKGDSIDILIILIATFSISYFLRNRNKN